MADAQSGTNDQTSKPVLPDIRTIALPTTATKSALIRWLHEMGYSILEIHHGLGFKYQMVRNIVTTIPKRAARETLSLETPLRPKAQLQNPSQQPTSRSELAGTTEDRAKAPAEPATSSEGIDNNAH